MPIILIWLVAMAAANCVVPQLEAVGMSMLSCCPRRMQRRWPT